MDMILDFIKSDLGVAIAWLCTVISAIYGYVKRVENKRLKIEITNIQNQVNTDVSVESKDEVNQKGKSNVYTKKVTGNVNIDM